MTILSQIPKSWLIFGAAGISLFALSPKAAVKFITDQLYIFLRDLTMFLLLVLKDTTSRKCCKVLVKFQTPIYAADII
jgi:hypothetical protein